ncbi:MAG: hypothetical protein GY851_35975 [bacterium]|nr:hypothetical protein [bacterium]
MKKRIALGVLAILVLVVLIALIVLDAKFDLVRSAPRVSHETVARPTSSSRIVLDPGKAAGYLARHVVVDPNLSEGTLSFALPHEAALLIDPDLETSRANVTLFVNEKRLGPVIVDQANRAGIASMVPFMRFAKPGMEYKSRGTLTLDAQLPLHTHYVTIVKEEWGRVDPLTPPTVEGGHLLEAVFDNRDGSFFALFTSLYSRLAPGRLAYDPKALAKNLWIISLVRIQADLVSDDELKLRVVLECGPQAEEGDVAGLAFVLGTLKGTIRDGIRDAIKGSSAEATVDRPNNGPDIVLDLTLTNFTPYVESLVSPKKEAEVPPVTD